MQFEWDEQKNLLNQKKHRVSFELAQKVFSDPHHISIQDRHKNGEERWQTLGQIEDILILLVAHTFECRTHSEQIRIISARKATRRERLHYENQTNRY
ncbi:MAG: BrnT family toxin [gamma proteobacterium symbiont of Bathyaustriella thionipta]|nr:BrnT family toxin [gamma proteobacterium symbiont of Bathyaustriella thionipta]